jgi:hypothetical protein
MALFTGRVQPQELPAQTVAFAWRTRSCYWPTALKASVGPSTVVLAVTPSNHTEIGVLRNWCQFIFRAGQSVI